MVDQPDGSGRGYWDGVVSQPTPPDESRRSWKILKIAGAVLAGFVVLIGVFVLTIGLFSDSEYSIDAHHLDEANYELISPREFARVIESPDVYEGRDIVVWGSVSQFDAGTGASGFLAQTGPTIADIGKDNETAWIHAPDAAILADVVDRAVVKMYVEVAGTHSYETPGGVYTTVPAFDVYIIRVMRGERAELE